MANEPNYRSIFGKVDITSYLFSLMILFASVFAFFKSGSWMSLLSGLAFAILLSIGSYKTSLNRKDYHFTISEYCGFRTALIRSVICGLISHWLLLIYLVAYDKLKIATWRCLTGDASSALTKLMLLLRSRAGVCSCLCLMMGYRYLLTSKFMPAGLISSLSISMIFYLIVRIKIYDIVNDRRKKNAANKET